jgi:exodeoxyribonuclease VII large subunit
VISAVGHEVDISIADLVADVRAATPTAAAELAVPMLSDVLEDIAFHAARLTRAVANRAELFSTRLASACQRATYRQPLAVVHRREQLVDEISGRLRRLLANRVHHGRTALDRIERTIQRIAPHSLLLRLAVGLGDLQHRLRLAASRRIRDGESSARNRAWRIERASPINCVRRLRERVSRVDESLPVAMAHRLSMLRGDVRRHEDVLAALSYKSVLGRGFSLTRIKKGGRVVRSLKEVKDRDRIVTEVGDGKFEADVVNLNQQELFG